MNSVRSKVNSLERTVNEMAPALVEVEAFHRGELEIDDLSIEAMEIIAYGRDPQKRAQRRAFWDALTEEELAGLNLMAESGDTAGAWEAIWQAAGKDVQEARQLLSAALGGGS